MKEYFEFLKCPLCGNVILNAAGSAENALCCGRKPEKLVANTTDAAVEKHVPHVEIKGDKMVVKVGSVEHPMTAEHYIMWVAQVAGSRITQVMLEPGQSTEVTFENVGECKVYAYCNLHGLWVKEVK